jgi:GTP cyclohydrolase I
MSVSKLIKARLQDAGKRHFACDNISEFLAPGDLDDLVVELGEKFNTVLETLLIDTENDPNSKETGKRLAKMYLFEIMSGRFEPRPDVTAFPNVGGDAYTGMLVVRAEIRSMCSHHHQPVVGTAFIGILPQDKVLGLSKYIRLAQWEARRGTLQEELCRSIQKSIQAATETEDVAVYIEATHGCCENRGVMAKSSLTQTTVLGGRFNEPDVRLEFTDNIKLQKSS